MSTKRRERKKKKIERENIPRILRSSHPAYVMPADKRRKGASALMHCACIVRPHYWIRGAESTRDPAGNKKTTVRSRCPRGWSRICPFTMVRACTVHAAWDTIRWEGKWTSRYQWAKVGIGCRQDRQHRGAEQQPHSVRCESRACGNKQFVTSRGSKPATAYARAHSLAVFVSCSLFLLAPFSLLTRSSTIRFLPFSPYSGRLARSRTTLLRRRSCGAT